MYPVAVLIGIEGEQNARHVQIDIQELLTLFPGYTPSLSVVRPTEKLPVDVYKANVTVEGSILVWHVTEFDAAIPGDGSCQVVMDDPATGNRGKGAIIRTHVVNCLK